MKRKLAKSQVEEILLRAIFGDTSQLQKCDCETCSYEKDCEIDNPDFNANCCKV